MKKIISMLFLAILIVTFFSCEKEEDEIQEEIPQAELLETQTVTVTSSGGSYEINQFKIDIPSGTIENTTDVVLEVYDAVRIQEGQSSYQLKVKNIPYNLQKPITFTISGITETEGPAIATEWLTHSRSADTIAEYAEFHEAELVGGTLSYTLDISEDVSSLKNTQELPEFFQVGIFAVTGYGWVRSPGNLFLINAPVGQADKAQKLAIDLESFYQTFSSPPYNFSTERRTKYPIKVNLYHFVNSLSNFNLKDANGVMTSGFIGVNRHHISINTNSTINTTYSDYKKTAAHELFHLVQSYYDPREIQVLPSEFWWLEEATAVLVEEEAVSNPATYCSEVLQTHGNAPMHGLVAGHSENGAEHHGYGMASMFKYLTNIHGKEFLQKVFQERYTNGVPSYSAIKASLDGQDYSEWYENYMRILLQGGLYENQSLMEQLFYTTKEWKITDINEKSKVFDLPVNHLGAKVIKVNAKAINHSLTENARISAKILGNNTDNARMYLFARYPNTPFGFIGDGYTSVSYEYLKNLADNNGYLYIVLLDLKDDLVNTSPVNYMVEVSYTDGQNELKMMGWEFSMAAYVKYTIMPDSVTYLDSYVGDRVVPLDKITLEESGANTYSAVFDITDNPQPGTTYHWEGAILMELSEDLITLEKFTVTITSNYTFPDQTNAYTYNAVFKDLPYDPFYHHYAVDGNACTNHVESLSYTHTYTMDGITYQEELQNLMSMDGAFIYVGRVEGN